METLEGENPFIELLSLKDTNSLIIKTSSSSYWFGGQYINLLVFQTDGKIFKYGMFVNTNNDKPNVKRKEVKSKSKKRNYYNYLEDLYSKDKLNIDKSLLNIKEKPNGDGTMSTITISDSVDEYFEITQGNQTTYFGFYSVQNFIEANYPGLDEKKKFANLIAEFEKLIKEN
ncbi:MAG: hypothetical protein V4670_02080 [Bacteroidota bacterium]